jgi:hypothetical protein
MRINRETLLKIAEDTVAQRTRKEHAILAVYLSGSLLGDDYLLGGTTDIDLTFIHLDTVASEREIVRLTDEVHLDIAHHEERQYRQARQLRLHPWLGPTLFVCKVLYDPQHFLDFIQASVRGQFNRPDYVLQRARQQAEHARQIWLGFYEASPSEVGPKEVALYLRAVEHAINALASLDGSPLTERRLARDFSRRAEALGHAGLYAGLLGLLGGRQAEVERLKGWLGGWQATLEAIPAENLPPRLHPARRPYYRRAIQALLESQRPQDALWPLLHSWTLAAARLPQGVETLSAWHEAMRQLGLVEDGFAERLIALDAFLDLVEETLEAWGHERGE